MFNLITVSLLLQLRTKNINTTNNGMYAEIADKGNYKDIFRGIPSIFMPILYVNKYLHKSWNKIFFETPTYIQRNTGSITEDKPIPLIYYEITQGRNCVELKILHQLGFVTIILKTHPLKI